MFFGSIKGVKNSVVANTFIETCKLLGVSFWNYLSRLIQELIKRKK